MEYRALGRTGLNVSVLGFGCGDVGGLIVKGDPKDRIRAAQRAVELGINYFDTATSYGNGVSETHLGEVLKATKLDVYVGTKVRLKPEDLSDLRGAVTRSLEDSLRRLQLPSVELLQLHNPLAAAAAGSSVSTAQVIDEIIPALEALKKQGKVKFYGFTALGDPAAIHKVIDHGAMFSAQVFYNLLNPTAAGNATAPSAAVDFAGLLPKAKSKGIGTIGVRVLAAGALTGSTARHQLAAQSVAPIGTGPDLAADVRSAEVLKKLVKDGFVSSLIEAAYRFTISHDAISTCLVGASSLEQFEEVAGAVLKGPLPAAALTRVRELWKEMRS